MIAIDTNVLLRYLLKDNLEQSEKARRLIQGNTMVLVTDVVLVEAIWTLKGKKYNLDKAGITETMNALFSEPNIVFENDQVVWRALNDFIKAEQVVVSGKKKQADFPDALILNKAKYCCSEMGDTLSAVYTFDVAAREMNGTQEP